MIIRQVEESLPVVIKKMQVDNKIEKKEDKDVRVIHFKVTFANK
jgi:hypothetical protein